MAVYTLSLTAIMGAAGWAVATIRNGSIICFAFRLSRHTATKVLRWGFELFGWLLFIC
jgi:hypothetical protein